MVKSKSVYIVLTLPLLIGAATGQARPDWKPLTQDEVVKQALWSTPGAGRLVMLLRNNVDKNPVADPAFTTPMPYRVRVCVTNFAGTQNSLNLFVWTTSGPQPNGQASTQQPQVLHPGLGDCVEIDQPAAIIAQDATITGSVNGYYQLFQSTFTSVDPQSLPSTYEISITAVNPPNQRSKASSGQSRANLCPNRQTTSLRGAHYNGP
jgi:hypothetical protein